MKAFETNSKNYLFARNVDDTLSIPQITDNKLFVLQADPARICSLDLITGVMEVILNIESGIPDGIQIDKVGRKIYWTSMGARPKQGEAFILPDGAIECCNLDGTEHLKIIGDGAIVTPKQLQLRPDTKYLYWCDREGMAIYRSTLNGENVTELYRTGIWPQDSSDEIRHCVGIAIDLEGGHLYWTQKGSSDGGEGRIFRMSIEIPLGQTAKDRTDVELLIDSLPEPIDLEIDEETKQIYWTDRGSDHLGGNSLNRADISPIGLTNHKIIATGLKEGIGLALDRKQRKVYVADLSGTIRVVSMAGGIFETLYSFSGPVTGISF
ncbi:hypothetical protein MW336_000325 [Acinetobacter baumannii]|nr:hypothetical protein [Acinetobacter baumannii]